MTISHNFITEFCDSEYRTITSVFSATAEDIVWCIINQCEVIIWDEWPTFRKSTGRFVKIDKNGVHFQETATGEITIRSVFGSEVEWVEPNI